jgi:hypothetical protein
LRPLPEIDGVGHYGPVLRVALRGTQDGERIIRGALEKANIAVQRVTPGRASVEDAFVSMVREDEEQRSKGAAA